MEIYAIKMNGFTNPMGYLYDTLLCSWKVRGAEGKKQADASIEVAVDPEFNNIVYEINGYELNSLGVELQIKLMPHTRYYYRITVTTDADETALSEVCWFETAKLIAPWTAKWIGPGEGHDFHPEFRKEFNAAEVAKARLYISGLGLFEAYINNQKVGNDFLAPFINDYKEHIQYCTYDVTEILKERNELTVFLGKGWYMGRFGLSGMAFANLHFCIIAELHIYYADGRKEVIGTDESWDYRGSHFELTDIYDGEKQNYLLFDGRENLWHTAKEIETGITLVERYSPPLHEMESLAVKEAVNTPAGETVLDFGQNFAGFVECSQVMPYGCTMTLEFGEVLQNGNFYHENYRTAKSMFTYVSDGIERVIRPHFTFYGFRYVKVSGLEKVDASCFVGRAVYSDMDRAGYIETGNEKINRLHENTIWGLKSNFIDMPTDCPQRDERLGWTGDAQVFSTTAGYLMDTRGFYAKFMRDLRSDQLRNNGKIAIFLPNEFNGLSASVWSDIGTFLPMMYYTYYGSTKMLSLQYPMMRDWVDSVRREDQKRGEKYLWDFGFQFGDWLALDGATEQSIFGRTDNSYIASIYYYASVSNVAKAAGVLNLCETEQYEQLAVKIRGAILHEYFTPSGRLAVDTQTGYLLALRFGVYHNKQQIIEGLKMRIKKDCYLIKGGFVGATMLNSVLAENGMADLAYDFLLYEGFPGWIYAINLGATTIWERWNSLLPDGTISGTGMNSFNHYSYGSVMEFVYRYAAGITPVSPGFRKVRIMPHMDIRLRYLKCSFDSAAGCYVSCWEINEDGSLNFHFEVPFGCEAEIWLPEQDMICVQAGSYDFSIKTKCDYRMPYSGDTSIEWLLADAKAVAVINEYLPGVADGVNKNDVEAMSKSLNDMRYRALLFGAPTEAYDKAIEAVSKLQVS